MFCTTYSIRKYQFKQCYLWITELFLIIWFVCYSSRYMWAPSLTRLDYTHRIFVGEVTTPVWQYIYTNPLKYLVEFLLRNKPITTLKTRLKLCLIHKLCSVYISKLLGFSSEKFATFFRYGDFYSSSDFSRNVLSRCVWGGVTRKEKETSNNLVFLAHKRGKLRKDSRKN
jgi:hypothetical protein